MDRMAMYPDGSDDADRAMIDSVPTIRDGSFVNGFVFVVSWVDPDGGNCWRPVFNCDIPSTQVLGLLAASQMELAARTPGLVTNLSPTIEDQ